MIYTVTKLTADMPQPTSGYLSFFSGLLIRDIGSSFDSDNPKINFSILVTKVTKRKITSWGKNTYLGAFEGYTVVLRKKHLYLNLSNLPKVEEYPKTDYSNYSCGYNVLLTPEIIDEELFWE